MAQKESASRARMVWASGASLARCGWHRLLVAAWASGTVSVLAQVKRASKKSCRRSAGERRHCEAPLSATNFLSDCGQNGTFLCATATRRRTQTCRSPFREVSSAATSAAVQPECVKRVAYRLVYSSSIRIYSISPGQAAAHGGVVVCVLCSVCRSMQRPRNCPKGEG